MTPHLLYVDDEIENLKVFERLFKKDFQIRTCLSGEEGLKIFEEHAMDISLIVSDQRMPGMTGVDFLNACKLIRPEPIRIIITGYADLESTINAINEAEIYRFVKKPWEVLDLKQTLIEAQRKYELKSQLVRINGELRALNQQLRSIDDLKNKFMMLVNHELKTPITVQKSFLELLNETELNEEQKLFLNRAQKGGAKLEALVEEILFLLKLESYDRIPQEDQVNIKEVLEKFGDNETDLKMENDFFVESNQEYLIEALRRIVENAQIHKAKESRVELECVSKKIKISNKVDPENIPELEQIIKPFEIHENPFNHSKGLGLGLSVALVILEKLNFKADLAIDEEFSISLSPKSEPLV